jgi:hypothetical protein
MWTFTNQTYHVLLSCTPAPRIQKRAQDLLCEIDMLCVTMLALTMMRKNQPNHITSLGMTHHMQTLYLYVCNFVWICNFVETFGTSVLCCYMSYMCMYFDCCIRLGFLFSFLISQVTVVLNHKKWFENTHTHTHTHTQKYIYFMWKSFEFSSHLNWFQFKTYLINFKPTKE